MKNLIHFIDLRLRFMNFQLQSVAKKYHRISSFYKLFKFKIM